MRQTLVDADPAGEAARNIVVGAVIGLSHGFVDVLPDVLEFFSVGGPSDELAGCEPRLLLTRFDQLVQVFLDIS